ncbi:MAG: DUF2779 domain-containing protein [Burkholderiales bacterium]
MAQKRDFQFSKSRLMSAAQCAKRLYLETHRRELLDFSEDTERRFAVGHAVGEAARGLHPGGRLIGPDDDPADALRQTQAALGEPGNLTLFEATFRHGSVLVRSDILSRRGQGFHLAEVKAASSLKPHFIHDVAIQSWVVQGSGVPLKTAQLWHVDSSFVYGGDGDYRGLFVREDVTEQVEPLIEGLPVFVAECRKVLAGAEPQIAVGPQCTEPYECPFLSHCAPAESAYPVSILPYGGKLAKQLAAQGYADLREVPEALMTKPDHLRVWRASRSGQPELDPEAVRELGALGYPRYYLDFETTQFAVPIWKGTRPYEHLPFQWSCHIERADGRLAHKAFLDTSGEAPMRAFADSLIAALGTQGPVLVYSSFEAQVLRGLIARFPALDVPLTKILRRLVDLLPIARSYYYHPQMKGRWSIKSVLPTIAPELAYDTLGEVQDGMAAQDAYREMIHPETAEERRAKLKADLKSYCERDTLGLVEVARFLGARRKAEG